ncbi:MAG: flotillin family protein, partial [Verrucomicrobia bacterium]|nr:flotillin family protein [Verrucomicrobiota bacterium]
MNPQYMLIITVAGMVLVVFVFAAIWASRYVKVGPNRVLIVSGRQYQLGDGTRRGFRIVNGGGTFVFPVIEKADALSLEVLRIEMPRLSVRTAAAPVEVDCLAQVKINGDEPSILAAAEHFLSKNEGEMKDIVRPVLEKRLRAILGSLTVQEIDRDPEACAARVEAAVSPDLRNMGL